MDIIRTRTTGLFEFALRRQNELMKHNILSVTTTTDFVVGVDVNLKPQTVFLLFLVLSFSFHISHGLIYEKCDSRPIAPGGQVQQGNQTTLYFAVILAATERNDRTKTCDKLNWRNVRNLLAVQWVVNRLNKNNQSQSFIPGYTIDFRVFDDCGQPDIAFKHITDILEPSLTTHFNECPRPIKGTYPPFFAVLTLGNSSVTNDILEVAKTTAIPVVNPKVNLDSFQKYRNFVSLSTPIDVPVQAILQLLQKLKWTCSGIIYSDTEFGQQMKERLVSDAINHGICFAFNEKASNIAQVELEIGKAVERVKARQLGIVYLGAGSDMEVIFKNNNPKIHWIIFDPFGGHFKTFQALPNQLNGALTLYPANVVVNDFDVSYDESLLGHSNAPIDHWIHDLLLRTNKNLGHIPTVDKLRDEVSSVMDAVYVLATTKREMCRKTPTSCTKPNQQYFNNEKIVVDYRSMASLAPTEFRERNRSITIINNAEKNERPTRTVFNILNFWNGDFKKVGSFSQDELSVSLNEIKMTDEKGNSISANNLPKSLCAKVCEECEQPELRGRLAYIPGDILLLGIFSIHDSGPGFECGKFRKDSTDAIASEAFLYAIKHVQKISPNIKVGGIAIDDCYNSIQTSMNITMILSGEKKLSDPYTGEVIDTRKIVAAIGPLSSGVAKSLADLLTYKKILMISYAASSPDLDDKISYPYFLRTVPSDIQQVNAIISLLDRLDWRYVGIIYANNNYGAKAAELFVASAHKNRICVSSPKAMEESSVKATPSELENILDNLTKDQVKIVVYFGTNSRVNDLVQALKRKKMENHFVFIGCETWGKTHNAYLQAVAGSLTLTLDDSKTVGAAEFQAYLMNRTLKHFPVNNRFFNMFWYNFHKCNPPNGFRNEYDKVCTGNERFSDEDAKRLSRDQRSVQTMNAVSAVYEGIKEFQKAECKYINKVPCDRFTTHVNKFVKIMKTIKLNGYMDPFEVFDKDGNGKNTFNIYNIQRKGDKYGYEKVGTYNIEYNPPLRMARILFYDSRLQQIPKVNVTCVSSYKCCDHVTPPSAVPSSKPTPIRSIDIIILAILSFLLIFLIFLGSCYFIQRSKKKRKENVSGIPNREATMERPNQNNLHERRSPTVYIRSQEPESSYEGVVTYRIVKANNGEISQLTPTNSGQNHNRAAKAYNNSGFEPDDVFLFPETASLSPSTKYEEVARPIIREKARVLPERPIIETREKLQLPSARCYSAGNLGNINVSSEDAFII